MTVTDITESTTGGIFCPAKLPSAALFTWAHPYPERLPPGWRKEGTFKEIYGWAQPYKPLPPEATILIRQVPFGFNMDITSRWKIRTWRSTPYANTGSFTLNIPGVTDILRLPGLESPQLRRERALRMKASKSPLPQSLQWIPKVMNKLDDAQDLLITGLALLWPLLRRLPKPWLGPLGILLTISDILNLFT